MGIRRDRVHGVLGILTGLLVDPAVHPDEAAPLRNAYLARFPRAAKALDPPDGEAALLAWCRPC